MLCRRLFRHVVGESFLFLFFSSRSRHTRYWRDWSSDVCSSDLREPSMRRPITLFTGQWADLPFEEVARLAASWGYDGLEIACWGDHLDVARAVEDPAYLQTRRDILDAHGLKVYAISNHLAGQAVCDDPIDARHRDMLLPAIWGDGDPEGVRQRAAQALKDTAVVAAKL